MKPVVIVRNEQPDPGGVVLEELERDGLTVRLVDAFAGEALPSPEDVSGIVVFGGAQHADDVERHPYLRAEQVLLREAIDRGTPVLGICLGAQLLAIARGAALKPSPVREFGYTQIAPTAEGEADPLIGVYESGDRVFHWHEDTFDLPEGATLLASSDEVRNQAFRYGDRAWGVQFHVEVTEPVLEGWLAAAGEIDPKWGKTLEVLREENRRYLADEEKKARELVRRFAGVIRSDGR